MSEENKNRIIQFIQNEANNDTFLNIDDNGNFVALDEDFIPVFDIKKRDLTEAEFKEVFEVLKQYIRNNSHQFEMGDLVHENANWVSGPQDAARDWLPEDPTNPITSIDIAVAGRPWWSPIGTINFRRKVASGGGRVKLPNGRLVVVDLANCRKISHPGSQTSIHPAPFTAEQFEEIKNLVPGHCQIKGCYNFFSFHNASHPGPWGQEGHEVAGDICSFHRVYPDYHYDIMEEFGLNTSPVDNAAVQQYNQQINQKLQDFQNRSFALCEKTDELIAFFMSFEKENEPEVDNRVKLIFSPQTLPALKEELTGEAGDAAKQANNQTIEEQNPRIIQDWENNFTQKKAALTELEKIWDKIINPDTSDNPPNNPDENQNPNGPGQQQTPPNLNQNNPIIENNQQSEENIKDISQTSSLEEAKQKAQQEINDLLDRYGVKTSELSATLWDQKANWEVYLDACTTVEQVANSIKKMKAAILQQNQRNNQSNQKLSSSRLQAKVVEEIKEMLKKHPLVNSTDLSIKGQNWEEKLKTLTSQQQILNFARQLREIIVQLDNKQKQKQKQKQNSNNVPLQIIIPTGLGILAFISGILIIRQRKIRLKKKKSKLQSKK